MIRMGADDLPAIESAAPIGRAVMLVGNDPDTREHAPAVKKVLERWLHDARECDPGEDDTPILLELIHYDPDGPGGSASDYLHEHLETAFHDRHYRVRDREALIGRAQENILATALNPDRVFDRLGLPHATRAERAGMNGPEPGMNADMQRLASLGLTGYDGPIPYADQQASPARKGADTRRRRAREARDRHTRALNPMMLDLYWRNMNVGLVNGSPLEDGLAFADALAELQHDCWDPQAVRDYRRTRGFKRLERELLAGRPSTRRYRQMRDALCDDETEYRRFMECSPDVFDPGERIVNRSPA